MGDRPLVLVGPMASGKTAVGQALARRAGLRFVDSDRRIVARHGSIAEIFDREGEARFRSLEAGVVVAALGESRVVLSLGGGAVLHPRTRTALEDATVILLDTDLATVLPRITGDSARPLLAGRPAERWQELYDARRPVYTAVADLTVDTRGRSVAQVVDAVLAALQPAVGTTPPGKTPGTIPETSEKS